MAFLRLLAAFVAVACATPAAWADYFYCHAEDGYAESADGVTRYFSGVFYVSDNDFTARSSIGIAWGKHLAANYEQPQATNCLWEGTKADAVDEVNDMIAFARRVGHRVVNTGWKWAGRGLRSALHGASAPAWRQHMVFADNHGGDDAEAYVGCYIVAYYFVDDTQFSMETTTMRKPVKTTVSVSDAQELWHLHHVEDHGLKPDYGYRLRCYRNASAVEVRLSIANGVRETQEKVQKMKGKRRFHVYTYKCGHDWF